MQLKLSQTNMAATTAERVGEDGAYYLEQASITVDSDEEFSYEAVPVDDDFASEPDEDLHLAVRTIQEAQEDDQAANVRRDGMQVPAVTLRPELVDDFVCNFLVKMGMTRTLDCFQTEWYELQQCGMLNEEDVKAVPDIYTHNQLLDSQVKQLHQDVHTFRNAANKAKDTYIKLTNERDFHRMHHKRVVQEKNKLITDIKRLKQHYASYEPTLTQLKKKYELAMKEKMLTRLERDRAVNQVVGLQATLHNLKSGSTPDGTSHEMTKEERRAMYASGCGPTQFRLHQANEVFTKPHLLDATSQDVTAQEMPRHPDDSTFPEDNGSNPLLDGIKGPSAHLTRTGGFRLTHTIQAHNLAVSGIALHPKKQILATVSDDHTWKMWAIPGGDIIMTGEGHSDWVSDCDFHPSGAQLVTTSGDATVKIWDFSKAECIHTFTEHQHAVWGCSWHSCGDFVASCSMDNTAKIWDVNSLRCRYTLRGHADSVNSVAFLPYSNTLLTSSADKTISLWDARTGLCGQTFYGHVHSVNYTAFSLKGETVASCDSYGVIKLWDTRTCAPMVSIDSGPHPANKLAFDSAASVLAIASNDGTIKMYEVASGQISTLVGHEEAVHSVLFDKTGDFLVSGGADSTVRIWS